MAITRYNRLGLVCLKEGSDAAGSIKKFLSEDARLFIETAAFLYERMADRINLDFSPAIIELIKSFEVEYIGKYMAPLKSETARQHLSGNDRSHRVTRQRFRAPGYICA